MASKDKQPKKAAAKKAPAKKKAAAKKAPAKKVAAKKAPAKKPGRPPKAANPEAALAEAHDNLLKETGEAVQSAKDLIKSVSGVAPHTTINFVSELITANDIKSASLRKRVLKWFKRS